MYQKLKLTASCVLEEELVPVDNGAAKIAEAFAHAKIANKQTNTFILSFLIVFF